MRAIGPDLVPDPVVPSLVAHPQAQAASALAQLANGHSGNQDSIARAGGFPLLMALLASGTPEVQSMAALAITEVCRKNVANQQAAAESGCLASLVSLLQSRTAGVENDDVKSEAVAALWVLSEYHPENKKAIAGAGAIQPTVQLLAGGGTERAQQHADYALASLGFDNVDNQMQITKCVGPCRGLTQSTPEARICAIDTFV